jgi:hypothetical protein
MSLSSPSRTCALLLTCRSDAPSKTLQNCNILQRRGLGSGILRLVDSHLLRVVPHQSRVILHLQCDAVHRVLCERVGYAVVQERGGSCSMRKRLQHARDAAPSCLATAALATTWCGNRSDCAATAALGHPHPTAIFQLRNTHSVPFQT